MNRKVFFIVALLMVSLGLSAENITADMARTRAMEFFRSQPVGKSLSVSRLDMVYDGRGMIAPASSKAPALYVFDNPDGKGFVVVAGDDIAYPILGYSFENDFPKDNIPPHVAEWLKGMETSINYGRDMGLTPKPDISSNSAGDIGTPVRKLTTATWNQGYPYNLKTPTISGSNTVTGCVITAVAIVMYYHKYPVRGEGELPEYYTSSYSLRVPARTLGHEYKWNLMLNNYVGNYTSEQSEAVAVLMADLGHMLEADYGFSTGAYTGDIPQKLSTHMGYFKGALELSRYEYDNREWYDLLQNEIDDDRPVIYSGFNNSAGHAFILDGYTTTDYFSVNWGWGGAYNGYFLLDALEPSGSGIGGNDDHYNNSQAAIVNLKPEVGGEYVQKISLGQEGMKITRMSMDEVTFVTDRVQSTGSIPFTGSFRWCLVDKSDNIKKIIRTHSTTDFGPGYYYPNLTSTCYADEPFVKGDRIRLYYKSSNAEEWTLVKGNSDCVWDLVLVEDATIREATKVRYESTQKLLEVTSRIDVSVGIFSSTGDDYSSLCTRDGKVTYISTGDLPSDTYIVKLTDGAETVELKVKLN